MRALWLACSSLFLAALCACSGGKAVQSGKAAAQEAIPVRTGLVSTRSLPVEIRAIGNVQPYSTVSIKAQISGQLTGVHFQEGRNVSKGDLLFTIDPRPFEAALRQAEANLQQARANLKQAEANFAKDAADEKNAEIESNRYAQLFKSGVAAAEIYDQYRSRAESLKAALEADRSAIQAAASAIKASQAAIETARLQLEYTRIRSPIDGRTGNLMVHVGNLVKANDVPILVVINQIHPIFVSFAVPAQHLPAIKKHMAAGPLKVDAIPRDGGSPAAGVLTFVDNAIDAATSTIQLKGTFPNEKNSLWPGQFVDAVLTLAVQPNAVVVPSAAVQNGQQGQYVFVVRPDLTVETRPVVVSRSSDKEAVIERGLAPGEKVVIDGQLRLVPGARVKEAASGKVQQS
jgi:multidrug efflux system membrane fusion protein